MSQKSPKGAFGPFWDTFRRLKTLVETLFSLLPLLKISQTVLDTFSDTLEVPDTLPNTVLDTFYRFLKILCKAGVAHHKSIDCRSIVGGLSVDCRLDDGGMSVGWQSRRES